MAHFHLLEEHPAIGARQNICSLAPHLVWCQTWFLLDSAPDKVFVHSGFACACLSHTPCHGWFKLPTMPIEFLLGCPPCPIIQGGGKNAVAGIGKKCGKMRKKCGKCEKKCGIKCGFAKML